MADPQFPNIPTDDALKPIPDLTTNITSDIPPTIIQKTPERIQWEQDKAKQLKIDEEYNRQIKTVEKEIGDILWRYVPLPVNEEENPGFRASQLRDQILERKEYNIVTDKHTQVIYLYTENTGIYHKDGEQYLRFIIDKVLGQETSTRRINETIELLKIKTYAEIQQSPKIAVQNGVLNIQTGEVTPFSKYDFNTAKLNVNYKKDATSQPWLDFINQVCPHDKELLQEWSGYLLIKGYPYHALMWFYGPKGRNGKGTWARTMQAILGEQNYSAVQLKDLDGSNRFAVFNLHDSLLNICSEPRADKKLTIEMIQSLTGEDTLDAERKTVQERFKIRNGAKMTIMGNKFPSIDNPTDAWWERLKLIKWPYRFVGNAQVPNIEKRWLDDPDQRSGVLNWMIEGALRLIKNNGKFTATKSQEEVIIQFKRASDTIGAFIMECLNTTDLKATTGKADVQEHYKEYCDAIGVQPKSANELNQRLENIPNVKATSVYQGIGKEKKKVKVWKGFTLKEIPELSDDEKIEEEEPSEDGLAVQTTLGSKLEPVEPVEPLFRGFENSSEQVGTSSEVFPQQNPEQKIKNNLDNAQKVVPAVPSVPSQAFVDKYCGEECGNYGKPGCPQFTNHIPRDTLLPLKCYGRVPPLPTQGDMEV